MKATTLSPGRAAILLTLMIAASSADASESGFYGSVRMGWALANDLAATRPAPAIFDLDFKTGWNASGALGYRFSAPWRIDIETSHQRHRLHGSYQELVTVLIYPPCGQPNRPCWSPQVRGRFAASALFGSLHRDFSIKEDWTLSLGLGIGVTTMDLRADSHASFLTGASEVRALVDKGLTRLSGRGSAELSYDLGQAAVVAHYAYTGSASGELEGRGNLLFRFDQRLSSHALTAGVRYYF